MKMFLTRLGFNSKIVVTGDITQIDLPRGTDSGLRTVLEILEGVEDISISLFAVRRRGSPRAWSGATSTPMSGTTTGADDERVIR